MKHLSEVQDKAFKELRDLLCSEYLLQYPDFIKPFVVITDASGYAIGNIWSQGTIEKDLPLHTFPGYLIRSNRIISP